MYFAGNNSGCRERLEYRKGKGQPDMPRKKASPDHTHIVCHHSRGPVVAPQAPLLSDFAYDRILG